MSGPKFTPGPWLATGGKHPMNDPRIPRMWWLRENAVSLGTDNKADALLCAAAPDLYAALDAINEHWKSGNFSRDPALWGAMAAALAKARGEQS